MRDADSGAPIMMPRGIPLWQDRRGGTSLAPTVEFQAQPSGFDAIYTFVNDGKTERTLGALNAGIFTLGHQITYPDLKTICQPLSADFNQGYKSQQAHYPETVYSPAWVIENQGYAVGVSLQYPILDYRHDVRLVLSAPEGRFAEGEGGRGWRLEFLLSNLGNETEDNKLLNPGVIAAGQSRTYVISVRVTRKPEEWVRTLLPYRNWFRSAYGSVEYVRDPRPIQGRNFSTPGLCSDSNPFGYGDSRPDLNGWGEIVSRLMEGNSGYGTQLFWTTSGSYRQNAENNMPFQFTTNWKATPALATATDPKVGFPRIPASGQGLGLWWGRSVQVADRWEDPTLEPLDPDNKAHRAAAFAEMDLAVKAGATTIGLDTFCAKHTPVWDLVRWVDDLKARYPGVRFCAEPITCDLVHRKIATYYRGNRDRTRPQSPDQIDGYTNPHYLADFLLPGHETWGAYRWAMYQEWFNIDVSPADKEKMLAKIASLGYVPLCLDSLSLTAPLEAARSWEFTVPADLREEGNGKINDGGNGGGNDGTPPPGDDPFPTFELFDRAFKAGDMRADLTGDGLLDFFDYTAWQNSHKAGARGGNNPGGQGGVQGGQGGPGGSPVTGGPGANGVKGAAKGARMQVRVSRGPMAQSPGLKGPGGIVGSKGDGRTGLPAGGGRGLKGSGKPDFTDAEIAAALAKARGLDQPAATTAGVPDNN
jgi:hypothetical protein